MSANEKPNVEWKNINPAKSKTDNTGKVVPEKTNLILGLRGNEALQRKLSLGERRNPKDKKWNTEGFQVTKDETTATDKDAIRGIKAWMLTEYTNGRPACNFCVDCGRNDINVLYANDPLSHPAPGTTVIMESMPGLDLRPGDVIAYWVCAPCQKKHLAHVSTPEEQDPYAKKIITDETQLTDCYGNPLRSEEQEDEPEDTYEDERAARMWKHAIEWIQGEKLAGRTVKTIDG